MKSKQIFLTIASLIVSACGPGNTDWDYPIAGGYYLADAGGDNKAIVLRGNAQISGIVIDARVDKYAVDGQKILVARRPWIPFMDGKVQSAQLSSDCEYWSIDIISHAVRKIDDHSHWPNLSCKY